ncbi:hypothetical protein KML002_05130 [Klebsiella quasipneumoniae subsp. similipneumoniae]|nr:hypothetical protein NUKP47_43840 [Klebsiella quasipneumoniae]GLZ95244.1 hypothetical protein KML002_05130 [Klebsiella quasipneumoniae subsp. similipneumoniae]
MPAEATDNIKDFPAVLSLTLTSPGGRGNRPAVVSVANILPGKDSGHGAAFVPGSHCA